MLCFKVCFFKSDWIPRLECISVGNEFGAETDVYIKEDPSITNQICSGAASCLQPKERAPTFHEYCSEKLEHKIKIFLPPTVLGL